MTTEHADFSGRQERDSEIAAIRKRLTRLESERAQLEANLARLLAAKETKDRPLPIKDAPITNASGPAAERALFRSLFRGRDDVFPKRWENARTGKAGYAPACANEWVPRVCGKPTVKYAIRALINDSRRALPPSRLSDRPHPHFLEWHRQNCFKQ